MMFNTLGTFFDPKSKSPVEKQLCYVQQNRIGGVANNIQPPWSNYEKPP